MKTSTKVAVANLRQNKGRNLVCGVAILLTSFLVFVILTVGFGMIQAQYTTVNAYYPTWHMMYRDVAEDTVQKIKLHDGIERVGIREDFGMLASDDMNVVLLCIDDEGTTLNKMKLDEGTFPKEKNEIVLPKRVLEKMGIDAGIGDEISLSYQPYEGNGLGLPIEEKFVISGFSTVTGEDTKNSSYAIQTSQAYMESVVPKEERVYRVMVRLDVSEGTSTDAIKEEGKEIAAGFGIAESSIRTNDDYLYANYVDPSLLTGIAVIVLVVALAGILTIYSIYYVSMIPKVQEYGKLKALGASKHQIRQIVLREGMLVAVIAIPVGILISTLASGGILKMMCENIRGAGELAELQMQMLRDGKVDIFQPWIYGVTILVTFLTVLISLLKPMRMAAKISPVEAMRYDGEAAGKKKRRRGYESLNLFRLTKANLTRNKKRTAITVFTLGATGILYMVLATIVSCGNPKEMAKGNLETDYRIRLESTEHDQLHPEYAWSEIQKNNPINDELIQKIKDVPGVTDVNIKTGTNAELPDYIYPQDESSWVAWVVGLDETYAKTIEKGEIEGEISYEELLKGDKIIVEKTFLHWFPDVQVGDKVKMNIKTGDGMEEKTFEIAAIGEYSRGITEADFILPKKVVEGLSPYNMNDLCDIEVEENQKEQAYKELQTLAESDERLGWDSYEENVEQWESTMKFMSMGFYAFLIIMGGICMMNLVNTMISSIHTRRRELGMMQAIGMSEKQLIHLLQLEGLFYTAGTILVALGFGSLAGYGVFFYAKTENMMNIRAYHYPWMQALILVVVVTAIQLLLTYATSRSFRKHSLIERVRYAE